MLIYGVDSWRFVRRNGGVGSAHNLPCTRNSQKYKKSSTFIKETVLWVAW